MDGGEIVEAQYSFLESGVVWDIDDEGVRIK